MEDTEHDRSTRADHLAGPAPGHVGRGGRRAAVLAGLEAVGLGLGAVLVVVLAGQWFGIYFLLMGEQPDVSAAEETRFVVTATACFALVALGLGAALVAGHRWITALGVAVLVAALAVVIVLPVPSDRWEVVEQVEGPGPDYRPCYSGSGDCVGG